jgi:CBS domain-containing protein
MTVQDILSRKGGNVVAVGPDDTVLRAAQQMNAARIGSVVVFEPQRGVMGIFTERDVLCRVVGECRSPSDTAVSQVMTTPVTCCKPETTLEECKEVMTSKRLRHLPVVHNGTLVGIISTGDLLAQEVALQQSTIDHPHAYLNNWS